MPTTDEILSNWWAENHPGERPTAALLIVEHYDTSGEIVVTIVRASDSPPWKDLGMLGLAEMDTRNDISAAIRQED